MIVFQAMDIKTKSHNSQRCPDCKERVLLLLRSLYGQVVPNAKVDVPAAIGDFKASAAYRPLAFIHDELVSYRYRHPFTRVRKLPRCDFLLVDRKQVVEFDEAQHFSRARAISLKAYPKNMVLGFDRKKWMSLCDHHDAQDNDPEYRDEQRAWYDTLRDFLPLTLGFRPTIRLYAASMRWCTLSNKKQDDVDRFRYLLEPTSDG